MGCTLLRVNSHLQLIRCELLCFCLPYDIVGRQNPCEQTDSCENITFLQLRLHGTIMGSTDWRIWWGARDVCPPPPPPGAQILSISCSFRENLENHMLAPLMELAPPPPGKSWIHHLYCTKQIQWLFAQPCINWKVPYSVVYPFFAIAWTYALVHA